MSLFDLLNPTNSSTTSESVSNSTVLTPFDAVDEQGNVIPESGSFSHLPARSGTGEVGHEFEMESAVAREYVQRESSDGSHSYFEAAQGSESHVEGAKVDSDAMEVDHPPLPRVNPHEPAGGTEESIDGAAGLAPIESPVEVGVGAQGDRVERVKVEEEEMEVDIMGIEDATTSEQQHALTPLRVSLLPLSNSSSVHARIDSTFLIATTSSSSCEGNESSTQSQSRERR